MHWDLLIYSALYSYFATSWRKEAQRPGGIGVAWLIGGAASVGSIALLFAIALKVSWATAGWCILASFVGQLILVPILHQLGRSVVGLWIGASILVAVGALIVVRVV